MNGGGGGAPSVFLSPCWLRGVGDLDLRQFFLVYLFFFFLLFNTLFELLLSLKLEIVGLRWGWAWVGDSVWSTSGLAVLELPWTRTESQTCSLMPGDVGWKSGWVWERGIHRPEHCQLDGLFSCSAPSLLSLPCASTLQDPSSTLLWHCGQDWSPKRMRGHLSLSTGMVLGSPVNAQAASGCWSKS